MIAVKTITIKTKKEIEIMKEGGKILAQIMDELKKEVKPGISTKELNRVAKTLIFKYKAELAFEGHEGYPSALCVSVNDVIVHGVPSDYKLKEGDVISLDLGIKYKGFFSDMAITLGIGRVLPEASRLIRVAKKALKTGLKKARPGKTFGDISNAIQKYVENQGFNVVKELCGHGIGKELHEEPEILNFGEKGTGPEIKEGMVFCLEPMITAGNWQIKKSKDGFGWETKDGSLAAHFEETIAIVEGEAKPLTIII